MIVDPIQGRTVTARSVVGAADKLEQAFLEEMMKYAFPRSEATGFSGGHGEDQFGSFLSREYAGLLPGAIDLGFDDAMRGADE